MSGTLFNSRAYNVIRREIFSKMYRAEEKGQSIWFCCPFHDERTPSAKVNVGDAGAPFGWFYCFSCGAEKSMSWNKLASAKGLEKIAGSDVNAIDSISPNMGSKLKLIKSHMLDEVIADDWSTFDDVLSRNLLLPLATDWRGIPQKLLEDLGCKRIIDSRKGETFLVIPVSVDGQVRGLIRARFNKKKGTLGYITSDKPAKWIREYGLLGYDYVKTMPLWKKYRIVFLVEGPRDAMRLLNEGIPALAILGSQSWTKEKLRLVQRLKPRLVASLFDNDDAGRKAGRNVKNSIGNLLLHKRFKIPHKDDIGEELDPFNLPLPILKKVWQEAKQLVRTK